MGRSGRAALPEPKAKILHWRPLHDEGRQDGYVFELLGVTLFRCRCLCKYPRGGRAEARGEE